MLISTFIITLSGVGFFPHKRLFLLGRLSPESFSHENVNVSSRPPYLKSHLQTSESSCEKWRGNIPAGQNADSARPKFWGEGASIDAGFGAKRPLVFHFFYTSKVLMLKLYFGQKILEENMSLFKHISHGIKEVL